MNQTISNWIITIIGLIIINVLTDVILPKKVMSNIVKTISSLFILFSILSAILNIDFSTFNLNLNTSDSITVDSSFIENREEEICVFFEKEIVKNLEKNGYYDVSIDIVLGSSELINNVYVDLSQLVLLDNKLNINKYTNIVAIIKNIINVKEEQIIFYE